MSGTVENIYLTKLRREQPQEVAPVKLEAGKGIVGDRYALIGKKFRLGSALCQGVEDCEPCAFLAATVHRSVLPDLEKKAGLRAIILEDGDLNIGDAITPNGDE